MDTLLEYAPLATLAMVVLLGIGLWVERSESRAMKAEWKGHVDKDREALTTFMETTQQIRRERDKWERAVDVDRSNFKTFMKTLQRQFETFQQQLQEISALVTGGQGPWLGRSSPLRLTEEGQNLVGHLGARAWAKTAAEELAAEAKGREPFELEEMAFCYASGLELPRSMRKVGYNEDVPSGVIRQVLGVVLRDELIHRSEVT